jgi:peptidoglycan/xylan/chitin deacetylase (PgdA/CDA1 family)
MNILHVLSQFEVTGAEVYAVTLANAQRLRGHTIILVSDTLNVPYDGTYIRHSIGNRAYSQRFRNIAFLIHLIRENGIQIVHAHSRAASWVCYFATKFTGAAFISTVHGKQHMHTSTRAWNIYGKHIIVVCERLRSHLIEDLGFNPKNIMHIPNGIDVSRWLQYDDHSSQKNVFGIGTDTPIILFVGRLTGPKGDVVRFLISKVFPRIASKIRCVFYIIPGNIIPQDFPILINDVNQKIGCNQIMLLEFQKDVIPFMKTADVIIGSGRVAMESVLLARRTLVFGEAGYAGIIRIDNFIDQCNINFGDIGKYSEPEIQTIVNDLTTLLYEQNNSERHTLQTFIRKAYSIDYIEDRVNKIYQTAYAIKNSSANIPIMMYHRVVPFKPSVSRHGIWILEEQFERQMLSLKNRGFSPITFEYYHRFLKGGINLPARPIILTFDDGYEDNYIYAFPILQKFGYPAVIFSVTNWYNRSNFWDADEPQVPLMTKSQITEMARTGIEFGSHTINHRHLNECFPKLIEKELDNSRKDLEDLLGKEIISLAYPYGEINETIKMIACDTGYSFGIATDSGPHFLPEDFYQIRRIQIFPWTSQIEFLKKTQTWYSAYKKTKTWN